MTDVRKRSGTIEDEVLSILDNLFYSTKSAELSAYPVEVNLRYKKVTSDHIRHIIEASRFRPISVLDLYGCQAGNHAAMLLSDILGTNKSITKLDLGKNGINRVGALHLLQSLVGNQTMTELNLEWNSLDDETLISGVAPLIAQNSRLTKLDLHCNKFGSEGVKAVAEALTKNRTLIALDMRMNKIGDIGAAALAEALKQNATLQSLELASSEVKANGVRAVAACLQLNRTLTAVDLEACTVDVTCMTALKEALAKQRTITSFGLHKVLLDPECMSLLCDGLAVNRSITTLILAKTKFGDEGAEHLGRALASNRTLQLLDCEGCEIHDMGFVKILEGLALNNSITQFDFMANRVKGQQEECSEALVQFCKSQKRYRRLTIDFGDVKGLDEVFVEQVQAACNDPSCTVWVRFPGDTRPIPPAHSSPAPSLLKSSTQRASVAVASTAARRPLHLTSTSPTTSTRPPVQKPTQKSAKGIQPCHSSKQASAKGAALKR